MATKNLARTVVEGGRARYSKIERRFRNRSVRRLRFDHEGEIVQGRERPPGSRGFDDGLNPLERWLASHVGRGWNNVYREFCARFDRRTMKGHHIEEHVRQMVGLMGWAWDSGPFFLDERGILRRRARRRGRNVAVDWCKVRSAHRWAAGRRVIPRGDVLFWTAEVITRERPASRQGRRLRAEEAAFWDTLESRAREELTYGPVRDGFGHFVPSP